MKEKFMKILVTSIILISSTLALAQNVSVTAGVPKVECYLYTGEYSGEYKSTPEQDIPSDGSVLRLELNGFVFEASIGREPPTCPPFPGAPCPDLPDGAGYKLVTEISKNNVNSYETYTLPFENYMITRHLMIGDESAGANCSMSVSRPHE